MKSKDLDNTFSKGGEEELRQAMKVYGQPLLRYCHNILCDYFEAQDAVQMTFIKAYDNRGRFKKGSSLSAWLYRIAYTTCMDLIKKKKWLSFLPNINFADEEARGQDPGFIGEDLIEALLKLSPHERALVFNRVIDEKSYAKLEEIYGISSPTLRKRYERARKNLCKALRSANSYYGNWEGSKNEI